MGIPQSLTDKNQTLAWRADYTPFGDTNISVNVVGNPLRFPGQYFDQETGLHYNYYREYDPSVGRYIQSDPIGLGAGLNTYSYVAGNPLRFIDRYGLVKWVGEATGFEVSDIFGAGGFQIELTSECIDGESATVKVLAVGPAVGIGVLAGFTISNIEVEDPHASLQPSTLNGSFVLSSANITLGSGYGVYAIAIGTDDFEHPARPTGATGVGHGPTKGFGFGASSIGGSSTVIDVVHTSCGCNT